MGRLFVVVDTANLVGISWTQIVTSSLRPIKKYFAFHRRQDYPVSASEMMKGLANDMTGWCSNGKAANNERHDGKDGGLLWPSGKVFRLNWSCVCYRQCQYCTRERDTIHTNNQRAWQLLGRRRHAWQVDSTWESREIAQNPKKKYIINKNAGGKVK